MILDKYAAYFTSTVGMALAGVTAALAIAVGVQTMRLSSAQADYAKLDKLRVDQLAAKDQQIGVAKANNVTLTATIKARNAEVEAANATRLAQQEEIRKLRARFAEEQATTQEEIRRILSYRPVAGATDYDEAKKQLLELIKERRR